MYNISINNKKYKKQTKRNKKTQTKKNLKKWDKRNIQKYYKGGDHNFNESIQHNDIDINYIGDDCIQKLQKDYGYKKYYYMANSRDAETYRRKALQKCIETDNCMICSKYRNQLEIQPQNLNLESEMPLFDKKEIYYFFSLPESHPKTTNDDNSFNYLHSNIYFYIDTTRNIDKSILEEIIRKYNDPMWYYFYYKVGIYRFFDSLDSNYRFYLHLLKDKSEFKDIEGSGFLLDKDNKFYINYDIMGTNYFISFVTRSKLYIKVYIKDYQSMIEKKQYPKYYIQNVKKEYHDYELIESNKNKSNSKSTNLRTGMRRAL